MASVSTQPNHGHPAGVGAEHSGESVLGMSGDGGSRRGLGSMHPAPSLFEAPPTGSPRPEDPRLGHHGVRGSSSSGHSPRRGSMTTMYFDNYTLEHGLNRRSLSQTSPTSPPTQHETLPSTNAPAIVNANAGEAASTPYSNASSPITGPSQTVFPINEALDRASNRRASRRRTGPLSAESRERAGVIRRVGACDDCRRRRVACDVSHRGLSWDEARRQATSATEGLRELAPVSPSTSFRAVNAVPSAVPNSTTNTAPDRMELDPSPISPHSDHRPARTRRPLPTGPRLERTAQAALSLPPVDPARAFDQSGQTASFILPEAHGRYSNVQVLLLTWADERSEAVGDVVDELRTVLRDQYLFTCHTYQITTSSDPTSAWKGLSNVMRQFIEGCDRRDALKIVYYSGHTRLNQNRDMVLVNSPESGPTCEIRWQSIQPFLEETMADTLVLMDGPYFASNATKTRGVFEILAGGCFEDYSDGPLKRCTFTRILIEHLRRRAAQPFRRSLTVAELHAEICSDYPRVCRDWNLDLEFLMRFPTPLYLQFTNGALVPSIALTPLPSGLANPMNPNPTANASTSHITVDVTGDESDMNQIREWARMMPSSVQSVTIRRSLPNVP